jgi:ribosomal-protein-alanine N-acetyltransferase
MTGPLVLEEGGTRDIAEMMAVMTDAFLPEFGEAWTRGQCLGILDLPRVWLTMARLGGEPAGFALARVVVDEAELLLLGVRPAFRGQGIGGALIDRTLAVALASGARLLHLEVRQGNQALHLYNRVGFREVGRRRGYYRGGDGQLYDALSLSFPLGADQVTNIQT